MVLEFHFAYINEIRSLLTQKIRDLLIIQIIILTIITKTNKNVDPNFNQNHCLAYQKHHENKTHIEQKLHQIAGQEDNKG